MMLKPKKLSSNLGHKLSNFFGFLVLLVIISTPASAVVTPADWPAKNNYLSYDWVWPMPQKNVVRQFQAPATKYSSGHRGIDIQAWLNDEVVSPGEGIVHYAGYVVNRPVLSIKLDDGFLVSFEPVESLLKAGDRVEPGQVIGYLAEPKHCDPDYCLHLGVRRGGEYLNPLLFYYSLQRSVLYWLESPVFTRDD